MRPLRLLAGPALAGLAFLAFAWHAAPLAAQGVTTAAVSGTVTNAQSGAPLEGIVVQVVNTSTGFANGGVTNEDGRYFVPGLQIGGPYRVEATGLGYGASARDGLQLTLGQNLSLDFALRTEAVELEAVTVAVDPTVSQIINPGRTGAEALVTQRAIENAPSIGRNFTDFIAGTPLTGTGGGATSVAGQNNRFNSIQIDGVTTQDLFGLGSTGQPGGQAGARSITIEAVKEFQVLTAPYDVRQSGFSGGLVNAVTKSGTNAWKGSLYGYYRNEDFVKENLLVGTSEVKFGEFKNRLVGGTASGPIVRDRIHFFLAGEFEKDERPSGGIAIGREAPSQTGVDPALAQRFADLLTAKGVEAGSIGGRTVNNPNNNIFGRIDAQLSGNHSLTLRHNYVRAEDDAIGDRSATGTIYSFESNGYFFETTTNSSVAQLNSVFGNGWYNELNAGYNRIRDSRTPETTYPQIDVRVTSTIDGVARTKNLRAGGEFFSQANSLDQDSWEITDNLSFTRGDHRITLGVHDEVFKFRNLFVSGVSGQYNFGSLDEFEAGTPNQYQRNVPFEEGLDLNARFKVNQVAVYGQTEYSGIDNVVLTAGLRYDVPFVLDEPAENEAFTAAVTATGDPAFGGRSTTEVASGNGILSPRLGFNWDVFGDQTTQFRGGAGVFTGRHPYVWLSNLYTNNGLQTVNLNCRPPNVPAFSLDPNDAAESCVGLTVPDPPRAAINVMDPDFKYPHNWRFDIALDRKLPWGIVGTAEFIYTRAAEQIFLRELNLNTATPVSTTQGGRPVFGTIRPGALAETAGNNTLSTPNRLNSGFLQVIELGNSDQDRSYSITLQGQKRFSRGIEFGGFYTYASAEDISGLTSSIASSNIGFNPVKGNPNTPELGISDYEQRHKVGIGGSWDVVPWFTWSLNYIGNTGDGYSYTYDGDVNADGFEAPNANDRNNDLLYVPVDLADITLTNPADFARIDQYIKTEKCLSENRGKIMSRNVCQEPWRNQVNTRLNFKLPTFSSQRLELIFDLFNVLNFLSRDWGANEGVSFQTIDLLELRGWDTVNNRGIFRPDSGLRLNNNGTPTDLSDDTPNPFTIFDPSSRWQGQVGLRYAIN